MVALISGSDLGLLNSSASVLGQRGIIGNPSQGQAGDAAYLNVANGNLILQRRDEILMSQGLDVALLRTYNAQGQLTDDHGDHWQFGFSKRITTLSGELNAAGSYITRIDGDGSQTIYHYDASRKFYVSTAGAGAYDTLSYDGTQQQWLWTDGESRITEVYDWQNKGRLLSSSDQDQNTTFYQYNADGLISQVTDASGENTYFDYSGKNLVQIRVVMSTDNGAITLIRLRYSYDTQNRLTTVLTDLTPNDNSIEDGHVFATYYRYDHDSTRIAGVENSDGTRLAFEYQQINGSWRVTQCTDGNGRITYFAYSVGSVNSHITTVTDPLGYQSIYSYDDHGQLIAVQGPLRDEKIIPGVSQNISYAYDQQGNVIRAVDALGNVFEFSYDANGNQILQSDALGNRISRRFNSDNQLLSETLGSDSAQKFTTRYVYDDHGHLRFSISAQGRVLEYRYGHLGERISSIQYNANIYDTTELLENDLLDETELNLWVLAADKTHTTLTNYTYDARGQLSTTTSFAQVDANGKGIADGTESTVHYVYDQAGHLLQTIDALGSGITHFTYDGLGRVLSSSNALGQTTLTRYDDANNRVTTQLANGLASTSIYNKTGELIGLVQRDPNAVLLGETHYSYDAEGRLRMVQDASGQRSYFLYDAAGHKIADIDADGSLTEYVFNARGQQVKMIRYAYAINTALLIDVDGNPAEITLDKLRIQDASSNQTTWNSYDELSRLVKVVDAQGFVTRTDYDVASRVVRTVRYANAINMQMLGDAPTPQMINPATSDEDRVIHFFYDLDGKLVGELDAEGYLRSYRYDSGGRLIETLAYANATTVALRSTGNLAQLIPNSSNDDIHQYQIFDNKAQLLASTDAEGYLTEFAYDLNGNTLQKIRYATKVASNVDNTLEALRPALNDKDHVEKYRYNSLNQLIEQIAADGSKTTYQYDTVGHLVKSTHALANEARTRSTRFDLQGRVIAELSAEGAAQLNSALTADEVDAIWNQYAIQYQYDAAGHRISTIDQNAHRTLYYYDQDGRLAASINALGEVETRTYNALNELINTRHFATRLAPNILANLKGGQLDGGLKNILTVLANDALDSRQEYRYNSRGLLVYTLDELGAHTITDYNAFAEIKSLSQQIDATHEQQSIYRYDHRGLKTATIDDPNGLNIKNSVVYDAFKRVILSTDAKGHTRSTQYDRLGRTVLLDDGQGAKSNITYDAFDRKLSQTDSLGNVSYTRYNTKDRSVTVSSSEGFSQTIIYNAYAQQVKLIDANGNTTTWAYDKNGALLTTSDSAGFTLKNNYDRAGHLIDTTDANGHVTRFKYDAASRVLSKVFDPDGLNLMTTWTYDTKGQAISVTDPNGIVTRTEYDVKGQVKRVIVDPAGLNQITQFEYDSRGKTLQVTDAHVTQYVYDNLGRRTQQIVDPNGLHLATSFSFDANDNVIARTDANGNVTRFVYDANNRVNYEVNAEGGVTEYRYDTQGHLLQTIKYANAINLSGLPKTISASDISTLLVPDLARDNSQKNIYDRDGRLVFALDGNGALSRRFYDANGNVIRSISYATAIAADSPASMSALQLAAEKIADATRDAELIQVFDAKNRMLAQVDGQGAVTTFAYDGNGNLLSKHSYANRIQLSVLKNSPSLSDIYAHIYAQLVADPTHDQQMRFIYDAANRLIMSATSQKVDANGVLQWSVVRKTYDQNGHVIASTEYANFLASTGLAANPDANSVQSWMNTVVADSTRDRSTRMAYDAANRLAYSLDANNALKQYVYDSVGNLIQSIAYAKPLTLSAQFTVKDIRKALLASEFDRVNRTVYDAANRSLYDIDALGNVTERRYDGAGNVIKTVHYAKAISFNSLPVQASVAQINALIVSDNADRIEYQIFDAAQGLRYRIDAEGYVTQTDYDALDQVVRITQYANSIAINSSTLTLQTLSALVQKNVDQDRTQSFSYDAQGNLLRSIDPYGHQENTTYDALGRKLSFTNKKGASWNYQYDAAGHLISELAPQVEVASLSPQLAISGLAPYQLQTALIRPETRMSYDAFGNVISRTEAAGTAQQRITRYEYDAQGRQIRTIFPRVAIYNAAADNLNTAGVAARIETPNVELSSSVSYDALGNATMNTDVAGNRSYKIYDRAGSVVYDVDALGYVSGYVRNAWGEVTRFTRYANAIKLTAHTDSPSTIETLINATSVNHGADRSLITEYDRLGRSIQVIEPQTFTYDSDAALGNQYIYAGKTTRTKYNAFGDVIAVSVLKNPISNTWVITRNYYDKRSHQVATVDALGYLSKQSFDANGNVIERTEYATAMLAWDAANTQLNSPSTTVSTDDRTTRFTYDRLNRKLRETRVNIEYARPDGSTAKTNVTTSYAYDALGNLTRTTDASGASSYNYYDVLGRLSAVVAPLRNDIKDGTSLTPLTTWDCCKPKKMS